ncbi:DsbA family protein [Ferrimonas balearica]|uniref:DsbA family protein n=1 Tax=Ferrimonas balearica TaxID=44012 RepID=UPI001C99ED43|nr:DsbA family protein [Ferrimonas balearica]MBY5991163.1 DsbA family protein [Ferrimonas balearica]
MLNTFAHTTKRALAVAVLAMASVSAPALAQGCGGEAETEENGKAALFATCSESQAQEAVPAQLPEVEGAFEFVEGVHYKAISGMEIEAEAPYLVKFIWIGCPYCIDIAPYVDSYLADNEEVTLYTRHSAKNEIWERDARLYYALAQTGNTAVVPELMTRYVELRRAKTPPEHADFEAFFAERGLDYAELQTRAEGAEVNALVEATKREMAALDVKYVPTLVVNGKYMVLYSDDIETNEQRMAMVEYLMAKE